MKQLQVVLYGNELCSEQAAGRKGVKVCAESFWTRSNHMQKKEKEG